MIKKLFIGAILFLISNILFASPEDDAVIIMIKENADGIEFEKVNLMDNETKVFPGEEYISIVLPISPGRAGEYIEAKNREDMLVLSNKNGMIKFKAVSPDGEEFALPDIRYSDLLNYEIKISIINWKGLKQAYLIKNYDEITPDDGPVMNIFGGKIEPKEREYLISYDIRMNSSGETFSGSTQFVKSDIGWFLVKGKVPGGKEGYFILDFGATSTVILKDYLPEGVTTSMPIATQYTKDGEKKVDVVMQGANDTISRTNYLGKTEPLELYLGDLKIPGTSLRVLNDFPSTLTENGIIGVIGMDIIRRAGTISFDGISSDNKIVTFGKPTETNGKISVPFQSAGSFLILEGSIDKKPISFIVDTGARYTIIPPQTLDKLSVPYSKTGDYKELRGMDNVPVKSDIIKLDGVGLTIGGVTLPQETLVMSDPEALRALGFEKDLMILGMDIIGKYNYLGVDFNSNKFIFN